VDPNNFIAESSEADNETRRSLTVEPQPAANLVVYADNIGFTPDPYLPGDPVTIYATVLNWGGVVAEDVAVQFMDVTETSSRVPIGEPQVIQTIPPGGSGSVQITYETSDLLTDRQIEVIVDPNNFVYETKETDNAAKAQLNRAEAGVPNLVVTTSNIGFQFPEGRTAPLEGDEVTIIATVLNQGDRPMESVLVQFMDTTTSSASVPIGQQQIIDAIPPGGSGTAQVIFATTGKAGDRKIEVMVDPHNFIPETKETDNKATVTLKVAGAQTPNLVVLVDNIGFSPPSPTEGDEVTITATVLNAGATVAEDVEIQFMDASDGIPVPVGELQTIASLAPGSSALAQIRYATEGKAGSRRIQVMADPHNFIAEANESDNQASRSFTVNAEPLPNLVMLASNIEFRLPEASGKDAASPVDGDLITITAVVLNTGGVDARRVLVQFIDVTNAGSTPIGEEQIIDLVPVGSSATTQVVYDTTGLRGDRKIQVQVDSNNLVAESNDRDNEATVGMTIESAPAPNLRVLAENIGLDPPNPMAGRGLQIAVTVLNDGTAAAENVAVQFMDFTHGESTPIGVVQIIEHIPPGASSVAQETYTLPDEPGERRLRIVVDPDNTVAESDESDNRATVPIVVAPAPAANLRILESNIGFSDPAPTAGEAVTITATILNMGSAPARDVLVQFIDATGGGTEPIGAKQTITAILDGSSATASVGYDTTDKAGSRVIRVMVDPHTTIPENNETDNQATKTLSVAAAPLPNLTVPEANLTFGSAGQPSSLAEGEVVVIFATVINNGPAPAHNVVVQFVDATNGEQIPIGANQTIDAIEAGSSSLVQVSYDAAGKAGDREIRVVVDPNNLVAEMNESDNERTNTLEVTPAPAPNLVMKTENIGFSPGAPDAGTPVTLLATVRNEGSVAATEVRVQFIDSTQIGLALPIGETQLVDAIPPGSSALVQVVYSPSAEGDRTIEVVVDPNNTIAETKETDNSAKRTLKTAVSSTPNLIVDKDNIGFSRSLVMDGDQVRIHAVIRNDGSAAASDVAVHFADVTESGAPVPLGKQQILDAIPPGGSGAVSALYDTTGKLGKRSIEVIADPNNFIFESRETDNKNTVTLEVTRTLRPNLVMLAPNLGFNRSMPVAGDAVIVHAVVLNRGEVPVSDVAVYLMDVTDGAPVPVGSPKLIPTIPTGGSAGVQFSYETQGQRGDRLLRVLADPNNFIVETDETDNQATKSLAIAPPPAPNLIMLSTSIAFEPPNPGDGDLVTVRATVLNHGTANASDVVVSFLDVTEGGQTPIGQLRLIDTIAAGMSETAEVIYDTTDKAGDRTIRVIVDPNNTVEESEETDNTAIASLAVAAPPAANLVARAENITFSPSSPSAGQPVTITATVPNEGKLDAANVIVQFLDVTNGESTPIGDKQAIDLILAGGTGKAAVVYDTEGKIGERTIRVVIDPDQLIPESDETDNQASKTVTVEPPTEEPVEEPNLKITADDISFDPPNPGIGVTVTITAVVSNTGDADASNVEVDFIDATDGGSTPISETQTITSLAAGGSVTTTVIYETGENEGERIIRVVLDPDNSIPESNEEDNQAEKTLPVGAETEQNEQDNGEENGTGEEGEVFAGPNLAVQADQIRVEEAGDEGTDPGALTVAVIILNTGSAPAEEVTVRVADVTGDGPALVDERTIAEIPPGAAQTARLAYIPVGEPGERTLEVLVDPDDMIHEVDESDNEARHTLITQ
jgi:subtilase family serine protease